VGPVLWLGRKSQALFLWGRAMERMIERRRFSYTAHIPERRKGMEKFADIREPIRTEILEMRKMLVNAEKKLNMEPSADYALDMWALGLWVIEKGTPEQRQRFHDFLEKARSEIEG
jgi:hypothetical protein